MIFGLSPPTRRCIPSRAARLAAPSGFGTLFALENMPPEARASKHVKAVELGSHFRFRFFIILLLFAPSWLLLVLSSCATSPSSSHNF